MRPGHLLGHRCRAPQWCPAQPWLVSSRDLTLREHNKHMLKASQLVLCLSLKYYSTLKGIFNAFQSVNFSNFDDKYKMLKYCQTAIII